MLLTTWYSVVNNKGGELMAEKSRAEYFRELRKVKKQLVFLVDKEKAEALDSTTDRMLLARTSSSK